MLSNSSRKKNLWRRGARALLVAALWFGTCFAGMAKGPAVQTTGLDSEGITLISPASPGFDSLVVKLVGGASRVAALQLEPYLVVVSNQSQHTVVAYSILWKLTHRDGRTERIFLQHKDADAVAGVAGTEMHLPEANFKISIDPGQQRLNALKMDYGSEIVSLQDWQNFLQEEARNAGTEFAGVSKLEIVLDAVIFDDGTLIGPDVGGLSAHYSAYVEAKQNLFQTVAAGLEASRSMDDVFAPVRTTVVKPLSPEAIATDRLAIYPVLAAQEILGLRSRIGDQAVHDLFKQAIRKEPFVIHRRGG